VSLLDQFEVQFNELSNGEIVDGELSELQPVELAGIVNQEISRIQNELSPSEIVEKISISLSSHDFKRLYKFENLKELEEELGWTLGFYNVGNYVVESYIEDYTDEAIEMTKHFYSSDFANFGYSKDFNQTLETK
jgi:hypothetical protein